MTIQILKRKFVDLETCSKVRVSGHFEIFKNCEGQAPQKVAEFDNLFLNSGLNLLGTHASFTYCQVGTGNSTPAVGQVALDNFLKSQMRTNAAYTAGNDDNGDPYAQVSVTYAFPLGAVVGTISEIGISFEVPPAVLYSRALIVDMNGNPTTITLLATEYLTIIYSFRIFPPLADYSGTVSISGTNYNYTSRALNVTSPNSSVWTINQGINSPFGIGTVYPYADMASLAAVTANTPNGRNIGGSSISLDAYVNNSYTNVSRALFNQNQANDANMISGFQLTGGSVASGCTFQMIVNPVIPKNSDRTLQVVFSVSWARK